MTSVKAQVGAFLYHISHRGWYLKNPFVVSCALNWLILFQKYMAFCNVLDNTHIEIKEPNKHYSDYINRKGYNSIHVQAVCACRYCFLDVVVKWPGSVNDSRIFLNSSINKKLRNGEIPKYEKVLV